MTIDELSHLVGQRIFDAGEDFRATKAYLAYSGGSDSALMIECVRRSGFLEFPDWEFRVMSIDTGLHSEGHIERVNADMERIGLKVHWFKGEGLEWYIKSVMENGFGYTPTSHVFYYRMLKERAIAKSIQDFKGYYQERILSITGVRRDESRKRATTPIRQATKGVKVFLNPIADVTNAQKAKLMQDVTWWHGKTTEDCGCNWHGHFDIDILNAKARQHVNELNKKMKELGLWGYGEAATKEQLAMLGNIDMYEEMPENSFCTNCRSNL